MITMRPVVRQYKGLKPTRQVADLMAKSSSMYRLIGDRLLLKPYLEVVQKRFLSNRHKGNDLALHPLLVKGGGHTSRARSLSSSVQDVAQIKPWTVPMVEANGDYRDEAFLEQEIGGSLYENQSKLPSLPIPSLAETMERFLPTAIPLAKTKEEEMALKTACATFAEEAKELQTRLINRRDYKMKDSSWLQLWWNQLGYLQPRDSVVVNVSYFFHFMDDPTIGVEANHEVPANIQRAATLLYATGEFRKAVCSGTLEAETIGKAKTPLDATAYKYMFNACRVPHHFQDSYHVYDPSMHSHAIVARKGHFFAIDFVDTAGSPLALNVLENQLQQCIEMAEAVPPSVAKLGILTSTNRDRWADARESLLSSGGPPMKKALDILESGAILVCLDDSESITMKDCSEMFLTGTQKSGDNRWFDKSIQLIVDNTGQAGALNEHSMMDGMPVVRYADYITSANYAQIKNKSRNNESGEAHAVLDIFADAFQQMNLTLLSELEDNARDEFEALVGKQSLSVLTFNGFGSDFIKKSGNPPDAFVQVAIQLATYRLFGEQVGTYESTQVRPFRHGRTEVTRAVSLESAEFVKKMGAAANGNPEHAKEKLDLLRKATAAHANYSRLSAKANGVDRHLFGLSQMVDDTEEAPALYSDPVFNRSKRWRVSTSNLSHPRIVNWGFGQVCPDGIGIAYSIHPNSCVFHIAALDETGFTPKLANLLQESLQEMQQLAQSETKGEEQQLMSKL